MIAALAQTTVGQPLLNGGIFLFFVLVTLVIVFRASRRTRTAADYYAAGRTFTGPQNGIAISGDYLSAASFLGIAGAIAVFGYDGFLYSIGFLVAWLWFSSVHYADVFWTVFIAKIPLVSSGDNPEASSCWLSQSFAGPGSGPPP